MPEQRPTNERLGELLDELLSEVRELRKGQERLADDVQKLAERSERLETRMVGGGGGQPRRGLHQSSDVGRSER